MSPKRSVTILLTNTLLTQDVLDVLAQNGGKDAISDVLAVLQGGALRGSCTLNSKRRWRHLGPLSAFESTLRDLGFTVAPGKNERGNKGIFVSRSTSQPERG